MKIGSVNPAAFESYKANKTRPVKQEAVSMGSDSLEISESSRLFSAAMQGVKDVPEVRMERVEALRAQIQNGSYRVDSEAIADKILGEAL